ncbi:hypothetical protein COCVIDRAFT_17092 [Bipolaris victoriae FI3]|uniref:Uncharacterized protein n=1 Tax=Bipolaris victoriae (strain FI3) TaxID=930091 RepID=W7EFQ3_BIPV3|nr:hypothetical protein COCVIDRAFT_17092 [Bipolaris victoriae FI3]
MCHEPCQTCITHVSNGFLDSDPENPYDGQTYPILRSKSTHRFKLWLKSAGITYLLAVGTRCSCRNSAGANWRRSGANAKGRSHMQPLTCYYILKQSLSLGTERSLILNGYRLKLSFAWNFRFATWLQQIYKEIR